MTVAENLAFPLQVRRMGKAEIAERVQKALDMVQLGAMGSRRPAQLSGGQQQRVALARALVFEPRLVLMDEPLGALDKQLRETMQYEIKHIHENLQVTVVYVTHDQSEALTMSDRVAVFNDGVVQQLASPPVLYEKPDNAFVAQFIGENNRFVGTVREVANGHCVVEVDGRPIRALPVNIDGVGSRSTLSLRPERVMIDPDADCPNVFDAKVLELIYLGDHIRARMAVCGTEEFIVKVPNASAHPTLERGHEIKVGWQVDDCRALDA
jgi:putative spermidine/putrescine transport system ATP-binding protein